jgi:hypothetical protein
MELTIYRYTGYYVVLYASPFPIRMMKCCSLDDANSHRNISSLQNGAHLAAVVGGFVANALGWRWCFWLPAIIWGANWVINVFCLPETLYHRQTRSESEPESDLEPWKRLFTFNSKSVGRRKLTASDFTHAIKMLRYPSVLLPAIYYSISFGVGTVMFAVTGAAAFGSIYHFSTAQIGMIIGLPTLIGSIVGEMCAGPVSDRILYLQTKRNNGVSTPEARLQAMWPGFVIMPAGVIIEGVCLQYKTHWIGPAMGMAIGLFGLQIVSTNIFAYVMDVSGPFLFFPCTLYDYYLSGERDLF